MVQINVDNNYIEKFNNELDNLNSILNDEKILDDPIKFKIKLGLSDDVYKILNNTDLLVDFTSAFAVGGVGGSVIGYFIGTASLSLWTKFLVFCGWTVIPISSILTGGVVGVALLSLIFGIKKIISKTKQNITIRIPKFINKPIDLISINILKLLIYIWDKTKINHSEEQFITFLSVEWGFNTSNINKMMSYFKNNSFSYEIINQITSALNDNNLNSNTTLFKIINDMHSNNLISFNTSSSDSVMQYFKSSNSELTPTSSWYENLSFNEKKALLNLSFLLSAIDGKVDNEEMNVLNTYINSTFGGYNTFKDAAKCDIDESIEILKKSNNITEIINLFEQIINADNFIDEREAELFGRIKSKLNI